MKKVHLLALSLVCMGVSSAALAYPDVERAPGSADAPLTYTELTANPELLIMPPSGSDFEDRFLITASGEQLIVIDTETWELYDDQPEAFDGTIEGLGFLPNSESLFASLSDGTVMRVEIDDLSDTPETIDISDDVDDASLGPMAIDQDVGDSTAYILDVSNKELHIFDIADETVTSILLEDSDDVTYTPTGIAIAQLTDTDKIFISTSSNAVLVFDEGETTFSVLEPDTESHNFVALTATPNGEAILAVDSTDNAVWVIDTGDNSFLDQLSSEAGIDPITIVESGDEIENNALLAILATDVLDDEDVYAYIAGERGLSIADVSSPDSAVAGSKLVDLDPDSTEDANDPLTLSHDAVSLAASSDSDGYVYAGTTDDSIIVVSDNPFVTIDSDSVTDSLTTTASTFALTFQSDEAGTYRVVLNSDITGDSGTELIADTAFTDVDTDITTATIDITDFSEFDEGTNRIFVFVTDDGDHTGRDALDVTVDLPPEEVVITDLNFGNGKIFVTFSSLGVSDIDHYLLLAVAATSDSCPGDIDFDSLDATTADGSTTVSESSCGESSGSCESEITGLTNGTAYCIGARATDDSDQESATTGVYALTETPEVTLSLTELAGQAGCSLATDSESQKIATPLFLVLLFSGILPLVLNRGGFLA